MFLVNRIQTPEPKSQGIYGQTPRLRTPIYYGQFSCPQNANSHQRQLIAEPPRSRGVAPIAIETRNLSMHARKFGYDVSVRPSVQTSLRTWQGGIFWINSLWLFCRSERGSKEEYAWYFQLPAMELQALKDTLTSMAAAAESFPCEKLKLCP